MRFLSTETEPGMFTFKEINERIHNIIEETHGKVPSCEEFWLDELSRKPKYTLDWIMSEEKQHREWFDRRLFYSSVVEAQIIRLLKIHCNDYIVVQASRHEDQKCGIDFKLVPMFSGAETIIGQTKTFSITNGNKKYVEKDFTTQTQAFGRTAEYLTLEVPYNWKISKEERYSNPERFIYSPQNKNPLFYRFEDADIMAEQMQKESKRKCQESIQCRGSKSLKN